MNKKHLAEGKKIILQLFALLILVTGIITGGSLVQKSQNIFPKAQVSPTLTPSPTLMPIPTITISPSPSPTMTPTPRPTSTPSVTPRPTATPTPTSLSITVKLRFQGRLRIGADNAKTVTLLYRPVNGTALPSVILNTNTNGEAFLNIAPGSYIMLFNAPGYLVRRFGTTTVPVVITSSTLYLDLSASPLLGGDLNDDGVINAVDYTSNFMPNFLTNDPLPDLDGSLEVNNLDFTIIRNNWNLVNDTG